MFDGLVRRMRETWPEPSRPEETSSREAQITRTADEIVLRNLILLPGTDPAA
ncbi:MAG: hypothetical protein ACRELV_01860 [Longimicrobiales bacterium]